MSIGKKLPVQQINELRIKAVKLRLEGKTLKEINQLTGLSAPTIIAAHKAWQSEGWTAVYVRERGRKPGEGRTLSGNKSRTFMSSWSTPSRQTMTCHFCYGNWKPCKA